MIYFCATSRKTVDSSLYTAATLQNLLRIHQPIQAGIDRDFWEIPFDDPYKSHQRIHIKEFNEMHGLIETEIFAYALRLGGRLMPAILLDHTSEFPLLRFFFMIIA